MPTNAIPAAMITPALLPTFKITNASSGNRHKSTAHEPATVTDTVPAVIAVLIDART